MGGTKERDKSSIWRSARHRPGKAVAGGFALACAAASLSVALPALAEPARPTLSEIGAHVASHTRAYAMLQELTSSIGHRLTGTPQGKAAEEFALRKLRESGYPDAHFEPFPIESWSRRALRFSVGGKAIPALALGGSPAKADLQADLVDMGNGLAADYALAPERVRGKLALVYSGTLPGTPKGQRWQPEWKRAALAAKYGAKGVVFIGRADDNLLAAEPGSIGTVLPFPMIALGYDDGMALKKRIEADVLSARIVMTNKVAKGTARNIVATLPGSDPSADMIVFGAHLDSWDLAAGALDNGAGAMTVIDVARAFRGMASRPRRTIQFVLFMGEEQGMWGSNAYVKSKIADRSVTRIGYMFNWDMSHNPEALNTWGWDVDESFYAALGRELHASQPTIAEKTESWAMLGGDSDAFLLAGVPILYLNGRRTGIWRCQHAACDTIDIIEPAVMVSSVQAAAMVLFRLADAETLPAKRLSGDALAAYLDRNGLRD